MVCSLQPGKQVGILDVVLFAADGTMFAGANNGRTNKWDNKGLGDARSIAWLPPHSPPFHFEPFGIIPWDR